MSGIERHGIAAFFEFYNDQRLHQAPLLQQRGTANRCAGPPSARSSLGQQRRAVSSFEDRRLESLDLGASHPIREADTRRLVKGQRGGILRIVANNMIDLWRLPLGGPYGSLSSGQVFELKPR